MATASQLKALLKAHYDNQTELFNSCVLQIAAHEAQQGHGSLAIALKRILDNSRMQPRCTKMSVPQELNGLVMIEKSKISKKSLVISDNLSERLSRIIKEYRQQNKLKSYGLSNRRKILLIGPSGTGKTMTAKVLAHELSMSLNTIQFDRLVTKFMGETSAKLRQIFELMRHYPGIYLFDEFDAIGGDRKLENDVGEMRRILNSFLHFLEQDESTSIILAATNNQRLLDSALFRRFDDILYYEYPTKENCKTLIENILHTFKPQEIAWDKLLKECAGLSHAEITVAALDAVKQCIMDNDQSVKNEDLAKSFSYRRISSQGMEISK